MFAARRRLFQIPIKNLQTHKKCQSSTFVQKFKENQIPVWAGLSVIGFFHYRRIRKIQDEEIQEALKAGKLQKIENQESWKIQLYNSLPLDSLSRFVGDLSKKEIPYFARNFIFSAYCKTYGVKIEEALESDLTKYSSLNEFFRRKLKPGMRPIQDKFDLIAPCDGKVLHCGPITDENQIEQVKGN